MPGKRRFKSQEQATTISTFAQTDFSGGLNLDVPASEIASNELSRANNVLCYPKDVRGRSGSSVFNLAALPGSGTVHNLVNHSNNLFWLLHRGDELYRVEPNMFAAWVELTLTGSGGSSFGIDADSTIIQNKDDFVIGTTSGIFNILFSDTINADIVYPANGAPPDVALHGQLTNSLEAHNYRIVYTYVRLTGTTTFGRITPGAVLEQETGSVNIINDSDKDYGVIFTDVPIDETNPITYNISDTFTADAPSDNLVLFASYNTGDAVQVSSTTTLPSPLAASTTYYCIRINATNMQLATTRENAFAGTQIDITDSGTGTHTVFPNILNNFGDHHTHIGVYITADLGSQTIDPETNTGFNPEVYAWIADVPYTSPTSGTTSFTIDTSQEVWRARVAAGGFVLRTRQFRAIPDSDVVILAGQWFFASTRDDPVIYYSQITDPGARGISLGYYNNGLQSHKINDGVRAFVDIGDYMIICSFARTYAFRLNSFNSLGVISLVFQLTAPITVDKTTGVSLYSTISHISESKFIAVCSDASVRIFDVSRWGEDLSLGKVKDTEIKQMLSGAVGSYYQGAYFIWYPKDAGDNNNINTLRLAIEKEAGTGWSTYDGDDWIKPPFNVPPITVISFGGAVVNTSGISLFFAYNFADNSVYIIETFVGYLGGGTNKEYDDKNSTAVLSAIRTREIIGVRESNRKEVQEAHAYIRPQVEADGLPSGFELTAKDYVDGSVTATETITDVPFDGDIEFFKQAAGARLQAEFITNSSEFRLIALDVDYIEKRRKKISPNITQTDEAVFQQELSQDFEIWLTRYQYTLELRNGVRADDFKTLVIGTTAGPDGGLDSAISDGTGFDQSIRFTHSQPTGLNQHTWSFWVKDTPTGVKILQFVDDTVNEFTYVQFDDATTLNYCGLGTVTVDDVTTGAWNYIVITRLNTVVTVYQNKVSKGTFAISTLLRFGGDDFIYLLSNTATELYDMRVYNDLKTTTALDHYYDMIIAGNPGFYLP